MDVVDWPQVDAMLGPLNGLVVTIAGHVLDSKVPASNLNFIEYCHGANSFRYQRSDSDGQEIGAHDKSRYLRPTSLPTGEEDEEGGKEAVSGPKPPSGRTFMHRCWPNSMAPTRSIAHAA